MSGISSEMIRAEPVRRRKNSRSQQTVQKLLDAAMQELVDTPYDEFTVRGVAARAVVSPTTAYTYFPSKDALIAAVYLQLLREARAFVDVNDTAESRVKSQLRELVLLVEDRPNLANACTTAIIAGNAAVDGLRARIASEIGRQIAAALGPGVSSDVVTALHMMFSGAMMHARSTPGGYRKVADSLDRSVALVMRSRPTGPALD